jgi:hypothetical protein
MSQTPPLACTLGPAEMPERAAAIRALGRDALLSVERSEAWTRLRFRHDPAIRARVETIIAAESTCCAFLGFELSEAKDAIVVTLEAPEGGEPAMHLLADLFAAATSERAT